MLNFKTNFLPKFSPIIARVRLSQVIYKNDWWKSTSYELLSKNGLFFQKAFPNKNVYLDVLLSSNIILRENILGNVH